MDATIPARDTPRQRKSFGALDVRRAHRASNPFTSRGSLKSWARENATAIVKLHGLLPITQRAKRILKVIG